ncbi:acyl-CoA dehydrogenase family protein [Cytophagaceae bacterium ABcell3]|nr:acyl-CoA dehydrogenase family protein [Cytophagaceae bacterium ABcell3]
MTGIEPILDKVRSIANGVIAEESKEVDLNYKWPEESLKAIQGAGLGGLVVSKDLGGHGLGLYSIIKVCELIGEKCASASMCLGMHYVASAVIQAKATSYHKDKFLRPIAKGEHLTTLALSEPGSGAHFYYPQTSLTSLSDEFYKVNGEKTFVTNGGYADSYVLSTLAVDPEAPPNEFSCFVLEASADNLQWGKDWRGLGMRGNSSRSLQLKDVVVPAKNLLGEKGDQLWYMFNVVAPYFLIAMSGTYLGIAQAALNEAVNHITKRSYSHSGTGLADVPVLQHRLGQLWSKLERTKQLVYHAAHEGDKGEFRSISYIMSAKAEVAHCAVDLANEAMTLLGGMAYRDNSRIEILLRDARAAHIMAPTTDILYTWLGRAVLGLPFLGD